jgi:hypothetical protein
MRQVITTYIAVVVLLALGFFGMGALAKADDLRDSMQLPAFALQKLHPSKSNNKLTVTTSTAAKPKQKPLQLTSILISR